MGIKINHPTRKDLSFTPDTWYGLVEIPGKFAVDYNYYIDEGEQNSALYPCFPDDNGNLHVDANTWRGYNVDFSDPDWKRKLTGEALEYLKDIIEDRIGSDEAQIKALSGQLDERKAALKELRKDREAVMQIIAKAHETKKKRKTA